MRAILFSCASIASITLSTATFAQTQSPETARSSEVGGDIVVTALRTETSISKTPIAMTAVSGTGLRAAGVSNATDLSALVPNFALTRDSYDARIAIRGVTSTNVGNAGDPSVAFLIDGIYIARPADMLGSFFDVDRVEVLRGPQGTLYGRNTTAGVVNVITKKPSDKFEASFDDRVGNLGSVGATGMVNVPVGKRLGLRAAVTYDRQNSSLIEGVPSKYGLNPYRNEVNGRLAFGGKVGDNFEFVIRADLSHAGGSEQSFVDNSTANSNFFVFHGIGLDPTPKGLSSTASRTLNYAIDYPSHRDDTRWGIMADMTYHLGPVDLTYLGGYRNSNRDDYRNFRVNGSYSNPVHYMGNFSDWSHELRLSFGKGLPIHGQAGLYYFRETLHTDYNLGAPFSQNFGASVINYDINDSSMASTTKGAFGQLTYDITPAFHLTGGVRYSSDEKHRNGGVILTSQNASTGALSYSMIAPYVASHGWDSTTWKVGIDYDVTDLGLLYGSVSTGYKAGGFNDGCIAGTQSGCSLTAASLYYNPETITSYEGGFKFALFDKKMRINVSAFHYDYHNLQVSQFGTTATGGPTRFIQNAGAAKVDGVEADASFSLWPNGHFSLATAYTYARYTNFIPMLATGQSRNFAGLLLDHAPKWSGSVAYDHVFRLADGSDITAKIMSNYSSSYYIADTALLAQYKNGSYTKTDITLTYNRPGGKAYVSLFVQNLEDTITLSNVGSGSFANATIGQPRTFGLRAGFKY